MSTEDDAGLEPDAVDTSVDQVADVAEAAEPSVTDLATSLGWKPKDQWKGDTSGWTDAAAFVKTKVSGVKRSQDTIDRTIKATKDLLEKQKNTLIKQHEAELKRAREEGDTDAALEAQQAIHEARTTPDIAAKQAVFVAENPWFEEDDDANAIAVAAAERIARKGGSIDEQFEAAKKAVKKAMPELFDDDLDTPQPKPTPKIPLVNGGQRSAVSMPRAKGWNDVPAAVRGQVSDKFLKDMSLTREEYAKSYWQENGQ